MVQEYKMIKEKQAHESDEEHSDDSENSLTLYYRACASFKPEQGESNAESAETKPINRAKNSGPKIRTEKKGQQRQ
jgi:hypothetical protein